MATESPIRMPGNPSGKWPPSTNVAAEELGLLRNGPRFHNSGSRDPVGPNRSGSAPPNVEGSFLAIGNLISRKNFSPSGKFENFTSPGENSISEEQVCADPAYLAYYRSNVNLNPRLPPPVNSTKNKWGLTSIDDSGNGSRVALSTHKEEPEDDQPYSDVGDGTNGFWPAHGEASVPRKDKNLVDQVQENFPNTSARLYDNQSQSSSRELSEEPHARDTGSSSMHDSFVTNSSTGVTMIESKLKGLKVSGEFQNNFLQHHLPQQEGNSYQIQIPTSQLNIAYASPDQTSHGPSKFSNEAQPLHQPPGFNAPVYANPAAYMTSANQFYPNPQAAGFYGPPQYVGGPFHLNSNIIPSFIAGYPPQNMVFEGNASPNTNMWMSGVPPGGNVTDMQHYNKVYGQFGYVEQQHSFPDPIYMPYYQQPFADAYNMSPQFEPSASRSTVMGTQYNTLDSQKASSMDNQRAGVLSRVMTNHYFGNPQNMGVLMHYASSPLASPVIPTSPAGGAGLLGGGNEMRYPVGSGRYTGVYSGWQGQRASENINDPKICNFLEELKSGKSRRFELSDVAGHIVEFSADQHGSRFIQQKLEYCSPEEKECVFKEILPYASKLMTDVFGNYVIQKFFEYGSPDQRKELANQLVGHILPLSLQMYGCRVIQKALEVIELEQKAQLVRELDGHVMRCVRDQNGNHVIQKCIESVPAEKMGFIISAFRGQVATLSAHPYGCRVVQRVLEHCTDELHCQFIVDEILESVCTLAQDQYGNYVTQHVLERGLPNERSQIINKLSGHIVQLSQHKFASNVIEKCLEYGGPAEREIIIQEVIGHDDGEDNLLTMVKDQFANYVIQKVLETCTDAQRDELLSRIKMHVNALKKYTYGKHIVARLEQHFGEVVGGQMTKVGTNRQGHSTEEVFLPVTWLMKFRGEPNCCMALRLVNRRLVNKLKLLSSSSSSSFAPLHSHATSFGFKDVPEEDKSRLVAKVFDNVASKYDTMNDFMSVGLHRLWKDRLVSKLNPFPGMKHLDVAGGTGDVAFRILDSINSVKNRAARDPLVDGLHDETQIFVCDINPNMLNVGKKRAIERGLGQDKSLSWVEGDAEALNFEDSSMDGYTIAFGIRNVTHIEKALSEAYRVLKPGGRFLCLELSHVEIPVFKQLYDYYSFSVIPAVGQLVAGDRSSYQYLVESIRRFPPQKNNCAFLSNELELRLNSAEAQNLTNEKAQLNLEKFAGMIAEAGFQKVEFENLVGGVVAIHSGLKF
ncbi:hypothetical protein ACFE04_010132 [Oxalis oulophora]